jgi:hypothetical protein
MFIVIMIVQCHYYCHNATQSHIYILTPEDGQLRSKHVVKEKGECIYETELHCDDSSDIAREIMQQDA